VILKTLDFSLLSEFSVGTGIPVHRELSISGLINNAQRKILACRHPSPAGSPGRLAQWSASSFHLGHGSRAFSGSHRCERTWTIELDLPRKMWLWASLCVRTIRFMRRDAG
jgi:hypothetical protein